MDNEESNSNNEDSLSLSSSAYSESTQFSSSFSLDEIESDDTSFTLNLPNVSPIPLETTTDHETLLSKVSYQNKVHAFRDEPVLFRGSTDSAFPFKNNVSSNITNDVFNEKSEAPPAQGLNTPLIVKQISPTNKHSLNHNHKPNTTTTPDKQHVSEADNPFVNYPDQPHGKDVDTKTQPLNPQSLSMSSSSSSNHQITSNNHINSPIFPANDLPQSQLRNRNRSYSLPDNFSAVFNNHDQALSGLSEAFHSNKPADNNPETFSAVFNSDHSRDQGLSAGLSGLSEAVFQGSNNPNNPNNLLNNHESFGRRKVGSENEFMMRFESKT